MMTSQKRQSLICRADKRASLGDVTIGLVIIAAASILTDCSVSYGAQKTKKDQIKRVSYAKDEPTLAAEEPESPKIDPNKAIKDESSPPTPNPPPTAVYDETLGVKPVVRPICPTPAAKMTVRLNPSSNRVFLPGEAPKSMKQVQDELHAVDAEKRKCELDTQIDGRIADPGVYAADPYGQYIYIHHEPLLFEDIEAERYGDVCRPGLQPLISFGKFMGTVVILPYKIGFDYVAANHEGGAYSVDYMGNTRPGALDGQSFPSRDVIRQYPRANLVGMAYETIIVVLPIVCIPMPY